AFYDAVIFSLFKAKNVGDTFVSTRLFNEEERKNNKLENVNLLLNCSLSITLYLLLVKMGIFKKGQKAYSIANLQCPRCHEGDMYPTATFSFKEPFEMHDRCPHCNQNFMPEPGFYYGAMFISYIWTGFFSLGLVLGLVFGFEVSIAKAMILLIVIMSLMFVWVFRVSRVMYINMVVHYEKDAQRIEIPTKK
ncbi:MAG: DUF983 domain-containing protein, partial [Saprospiraceae bacterium]